MDEPNTVAPRQPDGLKDWETPELIVEDVKDVTLGGTGDERILATEERIGTYYHS